MLGKLLLSLFAFAHSAVTVTIEGQLSSKYAHMDAEAYSGVEIQLDNGYKGFVQSNGQFAVHNVKPGSYILKVASPKLTYHSVRVDINAQGKIRYRRLNILTLKEVDPINIMDLQPIEQTQWFQKREQFNVLDTLKSPMVLIMILPMVVLFLLPKLMDMQDPELKKEMEEQMKTMNKGGNVPDMSELMSSFFGGEQPKRAPKKGVKQN
ncbi:Oidioi.mRNA.OKI2018_I69.XSR.g14346.t1.cds [Oikopleura dioica]|uniref:Endoplasmic reticulum membrane protein complex subunit 7 n=1 Tax=Oikopleura dioica TaxID=34765 RepID=A0ABN7SEI2_OIKDI|nr:Oidioi.mRNA.OKI2018_I69.XSR.g14346.t1.cds [Oikopleura dioica]